MGSELAGRTEEYISLKRAEYRAEAEQLRSDIQHIENSIEDIDSQLSWINNQANELKTAADKVKALPVGREYMAGELKKAVSKRIADVDLLEKNLKTAKADTQFLSSVSNDESQKKKLQQQIRELDKRIAETRKVRNNILATNAAIAYM